MVKRTKSRGGLPPNKYLNTEQLKQLNEYLKTKAALAKERGGRRMLINQMIVNLLLNSGLRAGELCQLQMRDLPHYHGKLVIDVREGKGFVQRSVQISSALADRIKVFVKRFRRGAKPRSYLFVNEQGGSLSYRSLYSRVGIIGRSAGVGHLTPHMLRHSYATAWYNETKDLFGLQDQLGHADTRTTHIYAKTSNEQMRRQVEDFDL